MTRFFFIDTSLILGYCNFLDYHHQISKDLLDMLNQGWARYIFLLFSIEMEFNRKIQDEIASFSSKLEKFLNNNICKLQEIKNGWGMLNNFEKYIFDIFGKESLEEIDQSDFLGISLKYYDGLNTRFNKLTKDWIKRPRANDYYFIKNTLLFKRYSKKILKYIHHPDSEHITLAICEVLDRDPDHEFIFYTKDNDWIGLDNVIGLKNFRIENPIIERLYIGRRKALFYSMKILELLNKGYPCLILARGRFINIAVNSCLYVKDILLTDLKFDKVMIDTEFINETRISVIKIYLSLS
ncbi:MAG: hypothetical protein ACFFAH_03660 [Promethearchaeota archaeon]